MPGGDGTGPRGMGPGTGWGMGGCVPAGRGRRFAGFGFGRGMRMGRGFGAWDYPAASGYFAASSVEEEMEYLKEERNALNERLTELEKQMKEKK